VQYLGKDAVKIKGPVQGFQIFPPPVYHPFSVIIPHMHVIDPGDIMQDLFQAVEFTGIFQIHGEGKGRVEVGVKIGSQIRDGEGDVGYQFQAEGDSTVLCSGFHLHEGGDDPVEIRGLIQRIVDVQDQGFGFHLVGQHEVCREKFLSFLGIFLQ
jgi:hypothetical protein